jgi:hypothetical protein
MRAGHGPVGSCGQVVIDGFIATFKSSTTGELDLNHHEIAEAFGRSANRLVGMPPE